MGSEFFVLLTLRLLLGALWFFCSVQRASSAALVDASRVELAAYYCVAQTDVFHATAAHEHDRVFLQIVPFAGNVGGYFHAVGETDTRYLSDGGVRLPGGLCRNTGADTALEGRRIEGGTVFERVETARERDGLGAPGLFGTTPARELIYRGHVLVAFRCRLSAFRKCRN